MPCSGDGESKKIGLIRAAIFAIRVRRAVQRGRYLMGGGYRQFLV
ncbi:DUF2285 domain-containing protein [Mesorhizobium sp. AR02]|nr:DUF2285 domain-containing protein [Mesorhizobium sp. AR02]